MKVVVNNQYGGFELSNEAVKQLVLREAKCVKVMTLIQYYGGDDRTKPCYQENWENKWLKDKKEFVDIGDGFWGHPRGFNIYKGGCLYQFDDDYPNKNNRADPTLVEVVKDLKSKANGKCATLKIVNIPKGVEWVVEEYDGLEWIAETHRTWP